MKISSSRFRESELTSRFGRVSGVLIAFVSSGLLLVILLVLAIQLRPDAMRDASRQTVRIYCAAGIAKPVEDIVNAYNAQYGTDVEIVRTGGSGELAGQITMEFETGLIGGADIYITADDRLLDKAYQAGVIAERFSVAEQRPVIAVPISNEIPMGGLSEMLSNPEVKFGIASEQAAVGKLVRGVASDLKVLDKLEERKATDAENVMTLAQALVAGSLDAAVIWDTTVSQLNQTGPEPVLKISALVDASDQTRSEIALGIVSTTRSPTASLQFARYLTANQTGQPSFENYGFSFLAGDDWEQVPEIHLYCGSMFTPVIESAIREFAIREGVNLYPRWEGCGKLVAAMRSIDDENLFPDAYLACDESFLRQVQEYFNDPVRLSRNEIVLAVSKTVPSNVESPLALANSNLRIGICDPEFSALGFLTRELLSEYSGPAGNPSNVLSEKESLYQTIERQAAVKADVGPTLISQLVAGGLDAAFVYRSNLAADPKTLQAVNVYSISNDKTVGVATQPWAISKSTRNPALMQRLYDWLDRAEIRDQFKKNGFLDPVLN
ncbi:substrate-binding domain-containing protein [Mariniblastus sp.]|nr:substrate-binding domain-containing protein [bacterium]MDB4380083.1 substrate-binding domain-containing protein [Mariniblastus sp.]MDA7878810.1 substrate-binding domain-containing protein [bacterium]MDA7908957.1 substrate-binding domain-containing protein [bacterium]MDA7922854.1 substrate-binding domain-containing protein [bacterium]